LLALSGLVVVVLIGIVVFTLLPKAGAPEKAAPAASQTSSAAGSGTASTGADATVVTGRFEKIAETPDIAGIVVSDPNGDVDLGRYKGKALLINVWATWCAPCVAEMPSLDRLQAKLGGDHFAVVPVAVDEPNMAAVQDFMGKYQLQHLPVLLDLNHAIDHRIRIQSLPASLLVSPDGKILARFTGDNKWECGQPLAAVDAFIKTGQIVEDTLTPCAD
jgi:thiol-disulfide isomerase/thioredoxin